MISNIVDSYTRILDRLNIIDKKLDELNARQMPRVKDIPTELINCTSSLIRTYTVLKYSGVPMSAGEVAKVVDTYRNNESMRLKQLLNLGVVQVKADGMRKMYSLL